MNINGLMTDLALRGVSAAQMQQSLSALSPTESFASVLASRMHNGSTISSGSQTMDAIFERASRETGVPLNLLKAVAKTESDFNPNCVSSAGAMGVMQLMPCNVEEYGVTDPFDPEQNIMAGAKQLADLSRRYKGDLDLTLAGYNAGSGNVAKYGGVPPFKETQNYIKKIRGLLGQEITIPTQANQLALQNTQQNVQVVDPASLEALLQERMEQLVYIMAQQMRYSLPVLDMTKDV